MVKSLKEKNQTEQLTVFSEETMCSFRMIEQRLIVVNINISLSKENAKKTTDHGHSRTQFAVPIKRSCTMETKKGTLDFTEMQDEEMVVT